MENEQLDLFIESDILCTCYNVNHALTRTDYQLAIDKLKIIKEIITSTGWDVSSVYYYYKDMVQPDCNAWNNKNTKYLNMRYYFYKQHKEIELNVKRT